MKETVLDAKKAVVSEIVDRLNKSASVVVVEYRGLSVKEVTELRRTLRDENVDLKVYKNNFVTRAVEEAKLDGIKESLTGPNAIAFGDDAVAPARVLVKFSKKHPKLVVKAGIVDGDVVGIETLTKLSSLPNKEGMLSMLLSCFQSPIRSFAYALNALKDAKEENGETAEGAVEEVKAEEVKAEAATEEVKAEPATEEAKAE